VKASGAAEPTIRVDPDPVGAVDTSG